MSGAPPSGGAPAVGDQTGGLEPRSGAAANHVESRCVVTLFVLSYLAGALTILAPCILPVVPFVFARVDQPFVRSGLPLLVGMVLSFAGVATLATLGGAWAADANEVLPR